MIPEPKSYGFSRGSLAAEVRDRAPRRPLPLGSARQMSELPQFAFFTPALLHLYGKIPEHAWVQLIHENPGLHLYYHRFDQPPFAGLLHAGTGEASWNHAICAVEAVFFAALLRALANTVVREIEGPVIRYFPQELRLLDPVAVQSSRLILEATPIVSVTGFAVDSTAGRVVFLNPESPRLGRPTAWRLPPSADTRAYAAALTEHNNPLAHGVQDAWRSVLQRTNLRLRPGQRLEDFPES